MKLSLEILKSKNACQPAIDYYIKNPSTTVEKAINSILLKSNKEVPERLRWSNWLLTRMFTKTQNIKYSIYAAELVIKIFEDKYPKDKRPRLAIRAAKRYLKNPTAKNKTLARIAADAADAAYADADDAADAAAADAAYAAAYAARAAAYAAAGAAYAAAVAARAAAAAAAAYAAYDKTLTKIIKHGLTLLRKK